MTSETSNTFSVVLESSPAAGEEVCKDILARLDEEGFTQDDRFAVHLAFEEAFANAVKHGNKLDVDKTVTIDYSITQDRFEIIITDQGKGFDPNALPDPRNEENLYKYGGRGVLLMQSYMDKVEYNPEGTSVRMFKNRSTTS